MSWLLGCRFSIVRFIESGKFTRTVIHIEMIVTDYFSKSAYRKACDNGVVADDIGWRGQRVGQVL